MIEVPMFSQPGLCAETDPDAFFPEPGESGARAKAVCRACPVLAECLDWAISNDEVFGIWGGMSTPERRRSVGKSAKRPKVRRTTERTLTTPDQIAMVERCTRLGWSIAETARTVGVHERVVNRVRARMKQSAAA